MAYSQRLTSGDDFDSAILPAEPPPAGGSSAAATKMVSPEAKDAMDTFILPAGDDVPEVRVWLSWGPTSEQAAVSLVVLGPAGATLYRFPIGQISQLHAEMQVPPGPGNIAAGMVLNLDLQIWRSPVGSSDPGTYNLALGWKPAAVPVPQGLTPDSGSPGYSLQSPPAAEYPSPSGGTGVGWIPAYVPPQPILPPSLTVLGRPLPAAGPGLVVTPMGPERPSDPASGGVPNVGGPHGPGTPLGPTPDLGRAQADRGSGVIVGPLPLGRSAPDGGIFERSFAATASPRTSASLVRRTSIGLAPSFSLPTAAYGPNEVSESSQRRGRDMEILGPGRASAGLVPPDGSRDSDEVPRRLIVLSPLRLRRSRPQPPVMPSVEPAPPRVAARPRRLRAPWSIPVAATLVAATSSAVLVVKLNARGRVRVPRC